MGNKFKVGDRVRRIKDSHANMKVGDIGTIIKVSKFSLTIKEYLGEGDCTHDPDNFELVKEIKMKKFKNKLAVKGSKSLLKAFKEELISLGYKWTDFSIEDCNYIVVNTSNTGLAFYNQSYGRADIKLSLPKDWDKALKLAAEVEEEILFKEGDWLYKKLSVSEWICKFKSFNNVNGISSTEYYQVSEDELIGEGAVNDLSSDNVRLATDEEIKRILTKVAEFKYPVGSIIIALNTEETKLNVNAGKKKKVVGNFEVQKPIGRYKDYRVYDDSNSYFYSLGQWAEIVKDPKLVINGHQVVKFSSDTVKIGCQQFHIHHIISMKSLLNNYGGTYVFKDNTKWTVDELIKILSVFD